MHETLPLFDRPRRSTSLRLPEAGQLDGSSVNPTPRSGFNASFVTHPWTEITTEGRLSSVDLLFRSRPLMSAAVSTSSGCAATAKFVSSPLGRPLARVSVHML